MFTIAYYILHISYDGYFCSAPLHHSSGMNIKRFGMHPNHNQRIHEKAGTKRFPPNKAISSKTASFRCSLLACSNG